MSPPRVLYKYKSLKGDSREHIRRLIVDRELYFARVDDFNDPFDCRARVVVPRGKAAEWRRLGLRRRPPRETREKYKGRHGTELFLNSIRKLGIFCSTPECLSILMWSYYTEGHTGVCLGFRTTRQSGSPLWDSKKVAYSEEYPRYNLLTGSSTEGDEAALLRKANAWKHESEWRAFDSEGPGLTKYPENVLKEAILGCRCAPEDRDEVLKWVEASGQAIAVRQARRCETSFRLEVDTISEP